MNLVKFLDETDFYKKSEIVKVKLLAFFYQTKNDQFEFTITDICKVFTELGLPQPNVSRLRKNLVSSKFFVRSQKPNTFRLHRVEYNSIKRDPNIPTIKDDEEIIATDIILYNSLFLNTRGYIERLALQINCSYENNIFDGCAVLMRRLFEILLIHSYENLNIQQDIKDSSGNYKMLAEIVKDAKTNSSLSLTRDPKSALDEIRELGNYSAHKIYYNARKPDIDKVIVRYRLTVEELLYKSGIKK